MRGRSPTDSRSRPSPASPHHLQQEDSIMAQSDHWDDPNTGLPLLPGVPSGLNRRAFLMRHAVIGAAAVMTGTTWTPGARAQQAAKEADASGLGLKMSSNLSPDLEVVKASKGPVMTLADEFYKVGPGPSSSHTIGPMRITYDFYQRCTQLPADQLVAGHRAQGPSVRQSERHRQGSRHRACRSRRTGRQGAGDRRPAVPRRDDRQPEPDLPGASSATRRSTCRWPTSSTTRPRATSRTRTP